ncbi:MAG: ketopantoate reductase family protein, partial [Planctomycetota bacterium]
IKGGVYDFVLVCTKSFDSASAAADLSGHRDSFNDQTIIVLFQNGWGNSDAFLSFFERSIIYNARVITGFRRTHKNEVIITVHADSIHVGSLFKYRMEVFHVRLLIVLKKTFGPKCCIIVH